MHKEFLEIYRSVAALSFPSTYGLVILDPHPLNGRKQCSCSDLRATIKLITFVCLSSFASQYAQKCVPLIMLILKPLSGAKTDDHMTAVTIHNFNQSQAIPAYYF